MRGEKQTWLYTQGNKPSTDPNKIFGRQSDVEKIGELFNKGKNALALIGIEGVGKSTVASKYVDQLSKNCDYKGIYWRKIDQDTDITDIVRSFFTIIGKPEVVSGQCKVLDLLNLFFKELNSEPYFLVLDNFQMLMDEKTGKIKSGFSNLLDDAIECDSKSRFLFTCWECPISENGRKPMCYPIFGLDEENALHLLQHRGVEGTDIELREAVKNAGGHPFSLILLAQLIVQEKEITIQKALADNSLWKGEVAKNILDKIFNKFSEKDRELLQYVSIFREPIPVNAIVAVANDPSNPSWTECDAEMVAHTLRGKSVLNKLGDNYWEESLIRRYVYGKMPDADIKNRHQLASRYYLSLPISTKPAKKEDIKSIIEAHYHACKAQQYDEAAEVLFSKNYHELLEKWGNNGTLVELYKLMLPKDHFSDQRLVNKKETHGIILGNLGIAYRDLCDALKAINYFTRALKIAREIGVDDKRSEDKWLGQLGIAYVDLGDDIKAKIYFEDALKKARENGFTKNECRWLADLGVVYTDLGNDLNALRYYFEALKIAQAHGYKEYEGRWSGNIGCVYADLCDYSKAIFYFNKALKIAHAERSRRDEGIWLCDLGYVHSKLKFYDEAIKFEEDALKIAQEIGDKQQECESIGCIGTIHYNLKDYEKALDFFKKAFAVAHQISDKRSEGVWLYKLSLLFCSYSKYREAIACYLLAKQINLRLGTPEDIVETESKIKELETELGEKEFTRILLEAAPKSKEILNEIMNSYQEAQPILQCTTA